MLMTGAADEQPRQVSYAQLLGQIRRAANMFTDIGGPAPGVAFMLPSLVETHVTLWGAETAGYAVPINFLLQRESIAELIKTSGAEILVADAYAHPVAARLQRCLPSASTAPVEHLRPKHPG